jgi:hypothetical protein
MVVRGANAAGAEAADGDCTTVVADAWAAGRIARGDVVAREEATADDSDDEESNGGAENNDPTDSLPSWGIVMAP